MKTKNTHYTPAQHSGSSQGVVSSRRRRRSPQRTNIPMSKQEEQMKLTMDQMLDLSIRFCSEKAAYFICEIAALHQIIQSKQEGRLSDERALQLISSMKKTWESIHFHTAGAVINTSNPWAAPEYWLSVATTMSANWRTDDYRRMFIDSDGTASLVVVSTPLDNFLNLEYKGFISSELVSKALQHI